MLKLETPETGCGMMPPAPQPNPVDRGQHPHPQGLSCFFLLLLFFFGRFNFLTKKEVGKKVALKIQSILLYFFVLVRQKVGLKDFFF